MAMKVLLNLALISSAAAASLYDLSATDIDGQAISLDFTGNVTVVINVDGKGDSAQDNYEMLKHLSAQYSEKPVRFLLVPCDLSTEHEPVPNADVKAFAQKYITLADKGMGSNVIMLAKSNVNADKCTYAGEDACTSASAACCPTNDAVYNYLLSQPRSGKITGTFDRIIATTEGKPYQNETGIHRDNLEAELSSTIDRLLSKSVFEEVLAVSEALPDLLLNAKDTSASGVVGFSIGFAMFAVGGFVGITRMKEASKWGVRLPLPEEPSTVEFNAYEQYQQVL